MQIESPIKIANSFRKAGKAEPDWLYGLRNDGWQYYQNIPFPDRVGHLWRYSDPLSYMIENTNRLMNINPVIQPDESAAKLQSDSGFDAFGQNGDDLSMTFRTSEEAAASGIVFGNLFTAARNNPDFVEKYLGKLVTADYGKFEALNMALWNTGIFLYVPDNTHIEKPIYLHRHPTGQATITRLLVVMGVNSEATIIDDYNCHCAKDRAVANSVVEIFAGDSARVRYLNLQQLAPGINSYITQRTKLGSDAESYSMFISLGGTLSKINAGTVLAGRGANSNIYGIAFADENQKFDHHTAHHHKASNSYSNIDFKIVLKDKTTSAYTGLIKIEKDALDCEAFQENRNLLLDKGTKADSIPELEILTDRVKCSHGATVGPIDPQMVFYLTSRGIGYDEAVKIIVSGFVEPTLNRMPKDLRNSIRDIIRSKLERK